MANWLADDDAEQLRFEFAREIGRLRRGALGQLHCRLALMPRSRQ